MKSVLNILRVAFKAEISSCMAYRMDFFISTFLVFLGELFLPLITLLIYSSGASYPGWTLYEVLLLQGVFLFSKGIINVLFSGVIYNTLSRVREGTFDLLLIKPRGTLFMAIITGLNVRSIGSLISGITIFIISILQLELISLPQILLFIPLFIISMSVLFSFNIISAAIVFKWVGNSRVFELFDCITNFGMYPKNIFSKATQNIISYIIPISIISFYPSVVILGKQTQGLLITSIVAIIFLFLSLQFWKTMLKNYTSAGG